MGIKFHCPNGHKLNVKSFLAGKRGVCPHCGAKVDIPYESEIPSASGTSASGASTATLRAKVSPEVDPTVAANDDSSAGVVGEPAGRAPAIPVGKPVAAGPPPTTPDPIDEAPEARWYVRPPSGGQFGPAQGEVMRRWINEGRVSSDSLVWREGWPEWKEAGPLFLCLEGEAAAAPIRAPVITATASDKVPRIDSDAGANASATKNVYRRRRTTSSFGIVAVIGLVLLSIILLVALFMVIQNQG